MKPSSKKKKKSQLHSKIKFKLKFTSKQYLSYQKKKNCSILHIFINKEIIKDIPNGLKYFMTQIKICRIV